MRYFAPLVALLVVFFAVFFLVVLPMRELSKQSAELAKTQAETALTQALSQKAIADTRKTNAEAHRLESELDRDKYGWGAVLVKEDGLGALSGMLGPLATCLIGAVILLLAVIGIALALRSKD